MNRGQLNTKDFLYDLPEDRIAKYPLADRNQSKLLVYKSGQIREDVFSGLADYLPKDALLVFNDTKVLAARLHFTKSTGAKIEVFCIEPYQSTVEQALTSTEECIWQCMIGNLKRFNQDTVLELKIAGTTLKARIHEKRANDVLVRFEWEGGTDFSSILEAAGEVPLPPYLKRPSELEDKENYQTVYAKKEGAVAAPTAGLHFVPTQLEQLKEAGHQLEYVTLFVGAGTFKPVKSGKLVEHEMHQERIVISKSTIAHLVNHDKPIICVGTTSLRSLESLYWLATKMISTNSNEILEVDQNDAYQLSGDLSFKEACDYILRFLNKNKLEAVDFSSGLFIMPSYEWKAVDGIITNFHQPGSTLLALIASWIGDDWNKVYDYALNNDYRFLSYGDSSLLLR